MTKKTLVVLLIFNSITFCCLAQEITPQKLGLQNPPVQQAESAQGRIFKIEVTQYMAQGASFFRNVTELTFPKAGQVALPLSYDADGEPNTHSVKSDDITVGYCCIPPLRGDAPGEVCLKLLFLGCAASAICTSNGSGLLMMEVPVGISRIQVMMSEIL